MTHHHQRSSDTSISIRPLTNSESDFKIVFELWHTIFPTWPIDEDLLKRILGHRFLAAQGRNFIATTTRTAATTTSSRESDGIIPVGFVLAYAGDEGIGKRGKKGFVSAIGVVPRYRGKGVGSALLERGVEALRGEGGEGGGGGGEGGEGEEGENEMKVVIGSETPRFWPGLPTTFGEGVGVWFGKRGFKKSEGPIIKDLFKDIRREVVPPDVKERVEMTVKEKNLRFAPWDESGYQECMEKQSANFSWGKAYAVLAASDQYHQVMVAFDAETNEQLGWTLMCGPDAIVKDMFAFMPISGDVAFGEVGPYKEVGDTGREKRRIGLIAAVGVDKRARGRGVGLAMVVRAMENLKKRGVEGIFIDSVAIRDFYEKLGYEMRWEYESWELVDGGEAKRD